MGIIDLFSKRQKQLRGEVPDVYQYNDIPYALRVQVIHIWKDAFGECYEGDGYTTPPNAASKAFDFIHDSLCREYGVFTLASAARSKCESVSRFLLSTEDYEKALDVIELSFKVIDTLVREYLRNYRANITPDSAIDELNARFREHGVGYQYEAGQIVRVDSQLIHHEVVKPALNFLSDTRFKGANQEFLSAHEHFRAGKYKECINDCLKAFESTMKAICDKHRWDYGKHDTAKHLIKIMFEEGLIPDYMQQHFSALRATLEAGVPTIRNKQSSHGQGSEPIAVPESIVAYALHLTASNIVFLAKAEHELDRGNH